MMHVVRILVSIVTFGLLILGSWCYVLEDKFMGGCIMGIGFLGGIILSMICPSLPLFNRDAEE